MRVYNNSKDSLLLKEVEYGDGFFKRLRGLMFSRPKNLVLKTESQSKKLATIHMMFMFYPLDVVWADDDKKVVDVKRNVKPFHPLKPSTWSMYSPRAPARYIIESPAGRDIEVDVGDRLEFEFDASTNDND